MNLTRSLLLIPLLAALIAGGCKSRETKSVSGDELKAENARLTTQITGLQSENQALTQQRDEARSALKRLQEQQGSIEGQLKDILGSGGEIAGIYRTERGGIGLDEDFAFAKGSADLNPEGIKSIEQLAHRLNSAEYAKTRVIVEGHTDDTPVSRASTKEKYMDNWGLSAARAAAVIRALQTASVNADRIHGAFRGEHDPRSTGKGEKEKAANRRVEIYLK